MLSVSRSARKSEENETQDNCNNEAEVIPVEA